MSISVIIPSALRQMPSGDFWLERAIRSVLTQTMPPKEIVVALDPAVALPQAVHPLAREDCPIKVVHGKKKGHQAACNAAMVPALFAAPTAVVAFLEDDDIWRPEHLAVMFCAMHAYGYPFVTASQMEVDAEGKPLRIFDFPTCSSWLIQRNVWEDLQGFDTRFRIHHDNEFLLRVRRSEIRRLHICEENIDLSEGGSDASKRPWLRSMMNFGVKVQPIKGLVNPTVLRTRHPDAILCQNGKNKERSKKEYAALKVLYGSTGW